MTIFADMPAGDEMDRAVAELVMRWHYREVELAGGIDIFGDWREPGVSRGFVKSADKFFPRAFHPSTNIAHAWEVVEKIAGTVRGGRDVEVVVEAMGPQHGTMARVHLVDDEARGATEIAAASADTAPLAICRAALMAVGP
jgi:hypothetical protein